MMRKHTLLGCTMLAAILAWQTTAPAFEEAGAVPKSWQLEFTHDQPRTLAVTLPDGSVRWYWYMAYKVVNNTGADRMFIPEFTIATDAGDIITAGQNVPAAVYPAVAAPSGRPIQAIISTNPSASRTPARNHTARTAAYALSIQAPRTSHDPGFPLMIR